LISGRFTIFTPCSLQFSAVIGDNAENSIYVNRVVWAINDVVLYWGLTAINLKFFPIFFRLYLSLKSLDRRKVLDFDAFNLPNNVVSIN
jgi:hypothetical protein